MHRKEPQKVFQTVAERWFLSEPALFAVYCSHMIVANDRLLCSMRSGKGRVEYNPRAIDSMTEQEVEENLRAEMFRILLKHPYERKPFNCSDASCVLASDCVLTSYYDWHSVHLACPSDFHLPDRQHYEWYAHEIEKLPGIGKTGSDNTDSEDEGKQGRGDTMGTNADDEPNDTEEERVDEGVGDSSETTMADVQDGEHADEGEDDSTEATAAKAQQSELWEEDSLMQASVNDLIQESKSWGSLPHNFVEYLIASTRARIDYRMVLSGFRASIISSRRSLTRMRPNRRTGFQNMGSLYRFRTNLLVGIDVSASVDSQTLAHVYSVVNRFFRYGIENIDVVQFDCDLGTVRNYKKANRKVEICGRGGTDFQPVVDYACSNNYDGLLIFTDGYAPAPVIPSNTHTQLLWVCQDDDTYRNHRSWMEKTGRVCVIYT